MKWTIVILAYKWILSESKGNIGNRRNLKSDMLGI